MTNVRNLAATAVVAFLLSPAPVLGELPTNCDLNVGKMINGALAPMKFSEFQAQLDAASDINADGSITVCALPGLLVSNEAEPTAFIKLAKSNLRITGDTASPVRFEHRNVNTGYLPGLTIFKFAPSIVNVSLENAVLSVPTYYGTAILLDDANQIAKLSHLVFRMTGNYSTAIADSAYLRTRNQTRIGEISDTEFRFNESASLTYGTMTGISTWNGIVNKLARVSFTAPATSNVTVNSINAYGIQADVMEDIKLSGQNNRFYFAYGARLGRLSRLGVSTLKTGGLVVYDSSIQLLEDSNISGQGTSTFGLTRSNLAVIRNTKIYNVRDGYYGGESLSLYYSTVGAIMDSELNSSRNGVSLYYAPSEIGTIRRTVISTTDPYGSPVYGYQARIDLISKSTIKGGRSGYAIYPKETVKELEETVITQ